MSESIAQLAARGVHDPITLEVIRNELVSIPNQVDKNITRTAFSPLISEYKDYAVGLVDPSGALVSQSRGSLAIFVANALGTAVRDGLRLYGADELRHGDIVISNCAATLGQHLNNVVMYTPVRDDGGKGSLIGFFCVLMHWIDVGGAEVGSCGYAQATEIYQEGIQFPTVKLMEAGQRRADVFRMIECNTRFPEMLLGDIDAQISGCFMGRQLVTDVVQKYGVSAFAAAVQNSWRQNEARVRSAIAAAPDGHYSADSFLDDDGIYLGKRVPVGVDVHILGDRIVIDFERVSDQLAGPLNAGRNGGAVAAARIALKYLFSPDEPVNEGDFNALEVRIPDGKFISASPGAAIGGSGSMIPTVVDTILKALAPAFPERAAAAHHGTYGLHIFSGLNPVTGKRFMHVDTCIGGWGATAAADGYGPSRSNIHGDTSDVPVECQEATFPYRLLSYELRQDSGGPGKQRGGCGIVKTYEITAPCRVSLKMERTQCPPWGLAGGSDGVVGDVVVSRDGVKDEHVLKGDAALRPGDRVTVMTAGGGGYGPARQRDVALVVQDFTQGYISREQAEQQYKVIFTDRGEVDLAATTIARSTLREMAHA